MDKYIIVRTFCDNEDIKNKIVDTMLNKKLVSGSQVSEIYSKYWWNNELEEGNEYKIELRTKLSLFEEVKKEIKLIHDYEVAEISYTIIDGANEGFLNWIENHTK